MSDSFISIIIPAKNAQATIAKCVNSVLNQDYPHYETIIVNDGSTDDTEKILSGYPNIKIINTQGIGPSKARNLAIQQAAGEFIAFTDADCIVERNWLGGLLKGFTSEKIAGVGGTQKSPDDESVFGRKAQEFLSVFGFIADYMKSGDKARETSHNPSCNVMYRKSVLLEMGGFLEGLWPGEDVELDYRIKKKGYELWFNPCVSVSHYRPKGIKEFSRMMFSYGKAQGFLVKRYGFFRPIHLVPIFPLILLMVILLRPILGLIIFMLLLLWLSLKISVNPKVYFYRLWVFLMAILAWNIGFMAGLFNRNPH